MLIESGVFYMLFFVRRSGSPPQTSTDLSGQMVQVLMSQDSINDSIEKSAGLTIAFTIYQYLLSLVVVRVVLVEVESLTDNRCRESTQLSS